ncbi:Bcr/CflA family efflux MFS transporter [Allofrancisella guangzhouensis]|uniref:Bcr/CflA family efflux transporter n=1 Tax=Allofrancisella guangzhouensis TaxID=594679 RepID=A0A0A8E5W7_9GAMM|nr:Bcr/CflA family efflux MFS transporter [Allofrancisella guangzhouensis]AJC48992.1 major facilitator transporter [Allofrancisella guangzhouensis]MBK2044150.1 Bcr/CflA family efflux MFS transporter [Allofrancisella guangzhouensis]MBK2045130.1 Bcr/CflA family efflux MFS transporter [Allofrancisella guangzhouensis]
MNYITRESKFFPIILALFAALPPLAVNTYAPAISLIAQDFGITDSQVLTTFATYFVGFSFGMLFWGAVSDKYGRKKIIIIGSIIYILSTILCSYSTSFTMLETLRFVQGLSDSVGGVIAFSIARDCYKGAKLTNMVASIIVIILIAPIIAPIIGTVFTNLIGTWQSTFYFLTFYGVIILIAALLIEETLEPKNRQISILKIAPSYFQHLTNPGFMLATIAGGSTFAALLIYISSSAIIYLEQYSTGSVLYCIYYGICAIASILANLFIKKHSHKIKDIKYTYYSIAALAVSCIALAIFNYLNIDNAFIYTIVMFILCATVAFVCTILYSFSINQVEHNFGTANSISNFIKNMIAASGSFIVSYYHGRNLILASPIVQLGFIAITVLILFVIYKMKIDSKMAE